MLTNYSLGEIKFLLGEVMSASKKSLALVMGGAFAASVLSASIPAAENPFCAKPLASGYMVADANKMKDGQCASGKCGATQKPKKEKAKEGSCHGDKAKEGACHADKK